MLHSYNFLSYLHFQSLFILLPPLYIDLSYFTQSYYSGCYHQYPHFQKFLSYPGMCHLVILLLPYPRYPDSFMFHFHTYPCVLYIHFQYLLIYLPIHYILVFSPSFMVFLLPSSSSSFTQSYCLYAGVISGHYYITLSKAPQLVSVLFSYISLCIVSSNTSP